MKNESNIAPEMADCLSNLCLRILKMQNWRETRAATLHDAGNWGNAVWKECAEMLDMMKSSWRDRRTQLVELEENKRLKEENQKLRNELAGWIVAHSYGSEPIEYKITTESSTNDLLNDKFNVLQDKLKKLEEENKKLKDELGGWLVSHIVVRWLRLP